MHRGPAAALDDLARSDLLWPRRIRRGHRRRNGAHCSRQDGGTSTPIEETNTCGYPTWTKLANLLWPWLFHLEQKAKYRICVTDDMHVETATTLVVRTSRILVAAHRQIHTSNPPTSTSPTTSHRVITSHADALRHRHAVASSPVKPRHRRAHRATQGSTGQCKRDHYARYNASAAHEVLIDVQQTVYTAPSISAPPHSGADRRRSSTKCARWGRCP